MADYTKGRHMLIRWMRNLNTPSGSTENPKRLDADMKDIIAILRALGFKLVSLEKGGDVTESGTELVVESKLSGAMIMTKTSQQCTCAAETSTPSWVVSGVGSKGSLNEADSSDFPKLSPEMNRLLHDTLIDIMHVMREVESKPNKRRNNITHSQENLHTAGFSPQAGSIRHASSMPLLGSSPATDKHTLLYPASPTTSLTSIPECCDPPELPVIDSTGALIDHLVKMKEELEKIRPALKQKSSNIAKPSKQLSTAQSVRKTVVTRKKSVGDTGTTGKGPAFSTRSSLILKRNAPVRASASARTPPTMKTEGTTNSEGGKGAVRETTPVHQTRASAIPKSTTRPRTLLSAQQGSSKQTKTEGSTNSEGGKGAVRKTTPVHQTTPSAIPRSTTRPRTSLSAQQGSSRQTIGKERDAKQREGHRN